MQQTHVSSLNLVCVFFVILGNEGWKDLCKGKISLLKSVSWHLVYTHSSLSARSKEHSYHKANMITVGLYASFRTFFVR